MEVEMRRVISSLPMLITLATLFVITFCAGIICAADFSPGIPIGSKIPAFEAKDQKGMVQTFESIRGPKGALLVFYRSADW